MLRVYEKVRAYMDEMGYKQVTIAEKAGIPKATFNAILNGKRVLYSTSGERPLEYHLPVRIWAEPKCCLCRSNPRILLRGWYTDFCRLSLLSQSSGLSQGI